MNVLSDIMVGLFVISISLFPAVVGGYFWGEGGFIFGIVLPVILFCLWVIGFAIRGEQIEDYDYTETDP